MRFFKPARELRPLGRYETPRRRHHRRHLLLGVLVISAVALAGLDASTATATQRPHSDPPHSDPPRSPFPAFVLDHGRYQSFEAASPAVSLVPGGINKRGVIVGERFTPTRETGFRRNPQGRVQRIHLPRAAGTQVDKINDHGRIVGNSSRVSASLPGKGSRGYVLYRGNVKRIGVPGARITVPHDINDRGRVVGEYTTATGVQRGFLWKRGRVTTFAKPRATGTVPIGSNDCGEIVGIYSDADGAIHGFYLRNGRYTTLDVPGATQTIPSDINDRGQIVVSAFSPTADDPYTGARGFVLRDGVRGRWTELHFPGALRTIATGIDDRGRIVGVYENPNAGSARHTAAALLLADSLGPMT